MNNNNTNSSSAENSRNNTLNIPTTTSSNHDSNQTPNPDNNDNNQNSRPSTNENEQGSNSTHITNQETSSDSSNTREVLAESAEASQIPPSLPSDLLNLNDRPNTHPVEANQAPSSGAALPSASSNSHSLLNLNDDANAIVITVNYVFSDEDRPNNPNRTGSLVLSLPNNENNRDPRVIQEFIRLATQMAYSSIINGPHTERGLSVEKFKSLPVVKKEDLGGTTSCSICYEEFESSLEQDLTEKVEDNSEYVTTKRRKTNTENFVATSNFSNSRTETEHQSDNNHISAVANSTTRPSKVQDPVYLSHYKIPFKHVPVRLPCNHIFGQACLCEWLRSNTTCPLCRFKIVDIQPDNLSPSANAANNRRVTLFTIPYNNGFHQPNYSNQSHSLNTSEPRVQLFNSSSTSNTNASDILPESQSTSIENESGTISSTPNNGRGPSGSSFLSASNFNRIFDYLRDSGSSLSNSIFPSGVVSRRRNESEGTLSESQVINEEIIEGTDLRSLFDDLPSNSMNNDSSNREE